MDVLRKIGLAIALMLYVPLLLLLPAFYSLNATIIKPTFVKETLVKAQVYEGISSFIVEQASKNQNTAGNTVVIASLQQATAAPELQKIIEPSVDSLYAWLDNPDSQYNGQINIEPLKANFMKLMEQNLQTKLKSLPPCTSRAQATTDPFSMTCLPPGTTPEQILAQTKAEIEQEGNLLGEEQTINLSEQAGDQQPTEEPTATGADAIETPKFDMDQLRTYARVYHWIKTGTPVLIGLAILATLGIALLSKPRYKGLRRLGILLVINAVLLLVTSVGTGIGVRALLPTPATGGSLGAAGTKAADIIIKKVVFINNRFTVLYLVVGVIAIIASVIIAKKFKGKKPDSSIEKEDMLPKDDLGNKEKPTEKPEPSKTEEKPEPSEKKINIS